MLVYSFMFVRYDKKSVFADSVEDLSLVFCN